MDIDLLTIAAAASLGLLTGSFANVAIHRLPTDQSIVTGRSACPACGNQIAGYDNIPVMSWLILRGKCRSCTEPIRVRYPFVEALTAVLFGLAAWVHGLDPALPLYLIVIWCCVVAAAIDLDLRIIPNRLTYKSPAVCLVAVGAAVALGGDTADAVRSLVIALALPLGFLALGESFRALRGVRGIGLGDVKFAVTLGFALGWLGGWQTIAALYLTLGSAIIITAIIAARVGVKMATKIPFGPHLAAGTVGAILLAPQIDRFAQGLGG